MRIGGELVIDEKTALLPRRAFARRLDLQRTGHIGRDRFGHINVQASLNGRSDVGRDKIRWRLDDDGLHAALDQTLVTRERREAARGIDAEFVAAFVRDLLKIIRDRPHLITAMRLEKLGDPRTASAIADDADPNFPGERRRRRGGIGPEQSVRAQRRNGRDGDGASEKLTARKIGEGWSFHGEDAWLGKIGAPVRATGRGDGGGGFEDGAALAQA